MHHGLTYLLAKKLHLKGYESGQYGSPPSIAYWARQAAVYVFALSTMKIVVVGLFAVWPGISTVGDWLLSWTAIGNGEAFQVILCVSCLHGYNDLILLHSVMGIFPIIMNILQFWLIDSIVKASSSSDVLPTDSPRSSDAQDREPLFRETDNDEDETRFDIENPKPIFLRTPTGDETIVASEDAMGKYSGTTSPLTIPQSASSSTLASHDYPPTSDGSSSSHSSRSRLKYKRSPPPPLEFRTSHLPAINSPDPPRVQSVREQEHAKRMGGEEQTEIHPRNKVRTRKLGSS